MSLPAPPPFVPTSSPLGVQEIRTATHKAHDPCADLMLNDVRLSRLAHELARGIYAPETVFEQYNISEEEFRGRIANDPTFRTYYAEAVEIWSGTNNTEERIKLKAGVVVEEWLREGNRLLHDPTSPMAAKVDLIRFLGRIVGLEPKDKVGATGPDRSVNIQINLSHAQVNPKTVEIQKVLPAEVTFTPPDAAKDGGK